MEKWNEYVEIPKGVYETKLQFGEEKGLIIEFVDLEKKIRFDFGNVISFRMIDEGYVQKDIYNEREIKKYKKNNFANIVYQVDYGTYAAELKSIADGYLDVEEFFHFVIITQNYNIDIITLYEPEWQVERLDEAQ